MIAVKSRPLRTLKQEETLSASTSITGYTFLYFLLSILPELSEARLDLVVVRNTERRAPSPDIRVYLFISFWMSRTTSRELQLQIGAFSESQPVRIEPTVI